MTLSVRSLLLTLTLFAGGQTVQMAAQANPDGEEGRPPRRSEGEPLGKGKGGPDGKRGPGGGKRGGSSAKVAPLAGETLSTLAGNIRSGKASMRTSTR